MKLETSTGGSILNPDPGQIEETLTQLEGDEAFAILSKDELTYIQVAGTAADGFVVEYQDGDTDKHFVAAAGPHKLDRVLRAFNHYAVGDAQWRHEFQWEMPGAAVEKKGAGCAGMLLLLAAACAGGIAAFVLLIA